MSKLYVSQSWRIVDADVRGNLDSSVTFSHTKFLDKTFTIPCGRISASGFKSRIGQVIEVDFIAPTNWQIEDLEAEKGEAA